MLISLELRFVTVIMDSEMEISLKKRGVDVFACNSKLADP